MFDKFKKLSAAQEKKNEKIKKEKEKKEKG